MTNRRRAFGSRGCRILRHLDGVRPCVGKSITWEGALAGRPGLKGPACARKERV